jgi:hypothetical protein
MTAYVSNGSGVAMNVTFTITDAAGNTVWSEPLTNVASNSYPSVTVPDEYLDAGQNYSAVIQASNSSGSATATFPFTTDLYGANVPEVSTCADQCIATSLTSPLYSSTIGSGQTVVVEPDPTAGVDFDSVAVLYGNISLSASGTGGLWIYDGDYQQPTTMTEQYSAGTTSNTISLTPADDGSITIYNSGSAALAVSISVTSEDTTDGGSEGDGSSQDYPSDSDGPTAEPTFPGTSFDSCTTSEPSCPATSAIPGYEVIGNAADPGFTVVPSSVGDPTPYHIYISGAGFSEWTSNTAQSAYSHWGPALPSSETLNWVEEDPDDNAWDQWAPDVINTGSQWVMYFTAYDKTVHHNCLGVAISSTAYGSFYANDAQTSSNPNGTDGYLLCDPDGQVAIDPNEYTTSNGTRYLVYKSVDVKHAGDPTGNLHNWKIKYFKLNTAGTAQAGSVQTIVHGTTIPIEAPSLYRYNNRIWMLTARYQYDKCEYDTDLWKSQGNISTHFGLNVSHIIRQDTPGKLNVPCGLGGADFLNTGAYVAFHGYKDGVAGGTRQVYVGAVSWSSTGPTITAR